MTTQQVNMLCDELVVKNRQLRHLIKRQRLIEQPSIQQIKSELSHCLGQDHGYSSEKLYGMAMAIRKQMLKNVDGTWAADAVGSMSSQNEFNKVRDKIAGVFNWDVPEATAGTFFLPMVAPEKAALEGIAANRKMIEDKIKSFAEQLPVAEWWNSHRGCSSFGLGRIVGESGNLSNYPNPDKLKKRMGLAPYKGRAGGTWRRKGGLTSEEWEDLGYNPKRRSVMFVICDAIIKSRGAWRPIYDKAKEDWAKSHPECSKGQVHLHAHRVLGQQALIKLWAVWNGRQHVVAVQDEAVLFLD